MSEEDEFLKIRGIKVVFDIGARDTIYPKLRPKAEYHLFEPNKEFFDLLPKGKNIHANNYGLGDIEGEFGYNRNAQAFVNGEHPATEVNLTLPIKTLDWYIKENNITRIDFLKIDTEGYDFKVLQGGPRAVEMARFIQYEHWDNREEFHHILEDRFELRYIGQRNVLCKRVR